MKRWLLISVILLKVLVNGAYSPFFLNNYILSDKYDYFDNISQYYDNNVKLFNSENFFVKNEKNLFSKASSLLFFNESFIHSKKNIFYLNIDLLSGKYGTFESLRNKFINVSYSFNIKMFYLGLEGIWSETNNDLPNELYNLQNLYFLKMHFDYKYFRFIFKYLINSPNFLNGLNLYIFSHYKNYVSINTFIGYEPDFNGIISFTDNIFKKDFTSLQTIENITISYPPYLKLMLYYSTCENNYSATELTIDFYHRTLLQFFFSDEIEIKRFFFKIPIGKRYTLIPGIEFNNLYYINLAFVERSKNYIFVLQLKNTLKLDIYNNFSVILKYVYYIN